jgi:hypothetical protein
LELKMSATEKTVDDLRARLMSLEQLLESPIVPGEMRVRFENVVDEFKCLSQEFITHRRISHEPQFNQIEEADAAMLARVDQLQEEDEYISDEIERLMCSFADLAKAVQMLEELPQNDEADLAGAVPALIGDALTLVIRIRMQENAIATWFVEAFQRDRGVAD